MAGVELIWPDAEHLDGYVGALRRGWSPNTLDVTACQRELAAIEGDQEAFLASLVDPTGAAPSPCRTGASPRGSRGSVVDLVTTNGGTLVGEESTPPELGSEPILRWRIDL